MCAKTRERRGKEQERRGRASTERESERKRRARSVERRYTGRTKRGVGRGESERERSLLVLLVASWPRTANEGVARWRARGRGKGDGWWNQTGAAATRRVSRSLCRAWKKRGEGRGSSKAAGKAGSSTYGWRATSAVWWLFLTRRCPLLGEYGRPFSSLEERRWPLASLDRSVGSGLRIRCARMYVYICVCGVCQVLGEDEGGVLLGMCSFWWGMGNVVIFCLRYSGGF